ncbi:hypothetical protein F2Q70_00034366 [Brassica cretica]|uniref:F-box domain-containing protein n=2 Tax=Brassica cretica TaxID=69181 RepID=A0A8S9SV07_BRACR|nr:hypothetical protein F2Q70_00034366 [Brassica cretica]KAF3531312.1 hypothetical protein DY000_02037093 [Brassica cretica]KAF3603834.1 hypothetical protein F2Q69_00033246 [Brassica cretica]
MKSHRTFLPVSPDGIIHLSLSLVSKSFRSLLSPLEIYKTRSQIGVNETCVYVCLKLPNQPCESWFSLWTNSLIKNEPKGEGRLT